jgi:hypothetical protein
MYRRKNKNKHTKKHKPLTSNPSPSEKRIMEKAVPDIHL